MTQIEEIKKPVDVDGHLKTHGLNDLSSWEEIRVEGSGTRDKKIISPQQSNKRYMVKFPKYGEDEIRTELFNCYLSINLGLNNALYFPCIYNGRIGIVTKNFLEEGSKIYTMKQLINYYYPLQETKYKKARTPEALKEQDIDNLFQIIKKEFKISNQILNDFFRMIGLDCLIGYGDRHWENYGFIVNPYKASFSPIYDTASGYLLEYQDGNKVKQLLEEKLNKEEWYLPKKKGISKIICKNDIKTNHIELFQHIIDSQTMSMYTKSTLEPLEKLQDQLIKNILGQLFVKDFSSVKKNVILKILTMRQKILLNRARK